MAVDDDGSWLMQHMVVRNVPLPLPLERYLDWVCLWQQ